jgi:2-oxoisovalerate dehydrogenase E2 component (dihydrolipoyl transacylase)
MSAVVRHREANKRAYLAREGVNLSYVAIVTKATVEALRRHPDMNAHWTEEGLWRRKAINVGIAVAVDDGLVVPVIKDADGLSIHGLNRAINELADRARTNRLRLDDVQGGTFTVDNTGWTGSILTMPIINVPEVGIVTMEAIVKRPVVIETPQGDVIGVRSMMNMVLAIDHRATDGAQAGQFLATMRQWLESVDESTSIW